MISNATRVTFVAMTFRDTLVGIANYVEAFISAFIWCLEYIEIRLTTFVETSTVCRITFTLGLNRDYKSDSSSENISRFHDIE